MTFDTLLIGLVVALIYVEIFEIYPGGIIVPAYVALHLDRPMSVLAMVAFAILGLFSYRVLSRHVILFGKRRFVTLVLLGVTWAQLGFAFLPRLSSPFTELQPVGWLIPGLLANALEKQRPAPTLASMLTVSIMTYFIARTVLPL